MLAQQPSVEQTRARGGSATAPNFISSLPRARACLLFFSFVFSRRKRRPVSSSRKVYCAGFEAVRRRMRKQSVQHWRGARRFAEVGAGRAHARARLLRHWCATADAPLASAASDSAGAEAAPDLGSVEGARAFRDSCAPCHGEDGRGGAGGGPPLDARRRADPELLVAMVNYGRGSMPPLKGMLTNEQIRAVAATSPQNSSSNETT